MINDNQAVSKYEGWLVENSLCEGRGVGLSEVQTLYRQSRAATTRLVRAERRAAELRTGLAAATTALPAARVRLQQARAAHQRNSRRLSGVASLHHCFLTMIFFSILSLI